jgi:hypothetical protein
MEQVCYNQFQGVSIFNLNSKAHRCITHIKSSAPLLEVHRQHAESPNYINVFHQYVTGFRSKSADLIISIEIDIIILLKIFHV